MVTLVFDILIFLEMAWQQPQILWLCYNSHVQCYGRQLQYAIYNVRNSRCITNLQKMSNVWAWVPPSSQNVSTVHATESRSDATGDARGAMNESTVLNHVNIGPWLWIHDNECNQAKGIQYPYYYYYITCAWFSQVAYNTWSVYFWIWVLLGFPVLSIWKWIYIDAVMPYEVKIKPLSETAPMRNFTFSNKIMWDLNKISIQEKIHETVLCKMWGNTDPIYTYGRW